MGCRGRPGRDDPLYCSAVPTAVGGHCGLSSGGSSGRLAARASTVDIYCPDLCCVGWLGPLLSSDHHNESELIKFITIAYGLRSFRAMLVVVPSPEFVLASVSLERLHVHLASFRSDRLRLSIALEQ